MSKDFEIIIHEGTEKYKEFMKVFGTHIVAIKRPIPEYIKTPHHEKVLAYFLDLDLITDKQREALIQHISEKFKQSENFVRENLDKFGVPVLKEHCSLIINNSQRWF